MPDFCAALSVVQAVVGAQRVLQLRGNLLALVAREAVHDACAHRYTIALGGAHYAHPS